VEGMTYPELADLERDLGRGPCLVQGAVFGACVGAIIGWFKGSRGNDFFENMTQGAIAGVGVNLADYGYSQWLAGRERSALKSKLPKTAGEFTGLAPYPLYRQSLTYPWSEH